MFVIWHQFTNSPDMQETSVSLPRCLPLWIYAYMQKNVNTWVNHQLKLIIILWKTSCFLCPNYSSITSRCRTLTCYEENCCFESLHESLLLACWNLPTYVETIKLTTLLKYLLWVNQWKQHFNFPSFFLSFLPSFTFVRHFLHPTTNV